MKYAEEVLEDVGSVSGSDGIGVVVFPPYLEFELTCIRLDTSDGRRHELSGEDAVELAELLRKAAVALAAVPPPEDEEDEDED